MAIDKFQKEQLRKLRSGEANAYEEASIYTILLDLCEGNGVDEVFTVLHNVAFDMRKSKELQSKIEQSKNWDW